MENLDNIQTEFVMAQTVAQNKTKWLSIYKE